MKLQYENNKQYKITLPKKIIDILGWKKKDEIKVLFKPKGLILQKQRRK